MDGIHKWAKDTERLEWHREVLEEYKKCKRDPSYTCSPSFLTKACQFGPAELALQTPYRAGVCHQMPWVAMATATDCFDPTDFSEEDETETVDDGDGYFVEVRINTSYKASAKICSGQERLAEAAYGEEMSMPERGRGFSVQLRKRGAANRCLYQIILGQSQQHAQQVGLLMFYIH